MPHVVHISSVHNAADPRIRLKQLGALVAAGWTATLVTGDTGAEAGAGERTDAGARPGVRAAGDGVRVVTVRPGQGRRALRLLVTAPRAVLAAARLGADLYHFHDPELLPWAWLLRLKGRPVVYDVHEDYVTSLRQKPYLPRPLRGVAAAVGGAAERLLSAPFRRVIAEQCYRARYPDGFPVLNYPPSALREAGPAFDAGSSRVLYTGNVVEDRGALELGRLVRECPGFRVTAIGQCAPALARAMRATAAGGAKRLELVGEGRYVPFDEIAAQYRRGGWLAGLALFPDTEHYREKELTKFFEYMAVGLPIVASDFPAWRRLIEAQGVGLNVDPTEPRRVGAALEWLRAHPREAGAMAERGRELVRSVYNWEHEGRRLIGLYRELIDPKKGAARKGSAPFSRRTRKGR